MGTNEEIGEFLDLLGNSTRRRILLLLANEPRYFIQLSKELGVSQQAVLKHLFLLENSGLIVSFRAKSNLSAPDRKYFKLNKPIYMSIGITGNSMDIKMESLEDTNNNQDKMFLETTEIKHEQHDYDITRIIKETVLKLQEINKQMINLENEKVSLLKEKQQVLQKAHQIIQESLDEDLARKILYSRLNSTNRFNLEKLSEELNTREKEIKNIIKKLEDRFSVELI